MWTKMEAVDLGKSREKNPFYVIRVIFFKEDNSKAWENSLK